MADKSGNKHFYDLLKSSGELHSEKNEDYSGNRFENLDNFVEAAMFAGVTVDAVFNVIIGVKNSRLRNLTEKGGEPNFEALNDTRKDKFVYEGLRVAFVETYGEEWLHVVMTEERFVELMNA